jgi:Spy/CpxP family protein refolding chaperone
MTMARTMKLAGLAVAGALVLALAPASAQEGQAPGASGAGTPGADPPTGPGMMRGMGARRMDDARLRRMRQERAARRGPGGPRQAMMFEMLFAAVDADGSDTLSLEEVLAVHERLFHRIDDDGDGELSAQEIRAFWRPRVRNR